ncbi:hypothetical protein OG194_08265 [Streptomyces sp. NBC_01288]|uniref:hypothetical protein n=1 Tax=Streptomyces sp. NBC_01288 TaxID=2903814 RepID=UPI002E161139|nr:hypothetical protein OG194_08265 [Streptomyces sp. NBC_01288]
MTSTSPSDNDRGCLRIVLAVPLVLLTLVAVSCCWTALTIRPSGSGDDDAHAGIVLACVLAIGGAGAVVGVWLLPSVRRVMGWWWVGPTVVSGVVSVIRYVGAG